VRAEKKNEQGCCRSSSLERTSSLDPRDMLKTRKASKLKRGRIQKRRGDRKTAANHCAKPRNEEAPALQERSPCWANCRQSTGPTQTAAKKKIPKKLPGDPDRQREPAKEAAPGIQPNERPLRGSRTVRNTRPPSKPQRTKGWVCFKRVQTFLSPRSEKRLSYLPQTEKINGTNQDREKNAQGSAPNALSINIEQVRGGRKLGGGNQDQGSLTETTVPPPLRTSSAPSVSKEKKGNLRHGGPAEVARSR